MSTVKATVKQWTCESLSSIDSMKLKTFERDIMLQDEEVLIETHYVGFNFADVFAILGLYEAAPKQNLVPGLEFSGKVIAVGTKVSSCKLGDSVIGVSRFGSYSTHIVLKQDYVKQIPFNWTLEQGAAFMVQALTAWYGLCELGNLPTVAKRLSSFKHDNSSGKIGPTVLVHSAAGGVGLLSLQILNRYKANVIATIGSADKVELLKKHGVPTEQIIVRTSAAEFPAQLSKSIDHIEKQLSASAPEAAYSKKQAGGIDLIFDSLGGDYLLHGYQRLNAGGRLINFGSGTFMPSQSSLGILGYASLGWKFINRATIDPMKMVGENRGVFGFNLIWLYEQSEFMNALVNEMLTEVQWQAPVIGKVFKFEDAIEAVKYFQSGKSVGKVVLKVK